MQLTEEQTKRFLSRIDKDPSGCWLWTGNKFRDGYGSIKINKKATLSHRLSYEYFKGKIPEGLTIDHLCKVRSCLNPDHLEAVTQYVNVMRGNAFSAVNARKTHCVNGHPFDEKNTCYSFEKRGRRRRCKTCQHISRRNYMSRSGNLKRAERRRIARLSQIKSQETEKLAS